MKVKFFSTYYHPNILGGGEISTQLLVEGLNRKGLDVEVITLGEIDEICFINNIKVKKIGVKKRSRIFKDNIENLNKKNLGLKIIMLFLDFIDIRLYKKFNREIGECDILHITNLHNFSGIPLLYLNKKKFKYIIQSIRAPFFDETNSFFKKIIVRIIKKIYGIYSKNIIFHFPTKYIFNYVKEQKMKITKYFIIGNTVDIKSEKIGEKENSICYSGSIRKGKGIKTLIKTFNELENKSIKLFLIGRGKMEDEIIGENIVKFGWKNKGENYEIIKKSKILVLPSEWPEAFGRVLIEAINLGTLPIGSDSGGIPEVLNYNEKYIFKTKDSNDLKEKIIRILNLSEEEYKKEIEILRKEVKKFSYESHIEEFIKMYEEILYKRGNI
ncbi:glycosyltransferase family 4 protein [uncultured Fusobacterium sp.]|uniref:glycosyltransferase family 4 protein n=1 Tax=uncultured Fusobacterium sp. TaxID=159267 RepID=UPI0025FA7539|nr:glycosyltransferase family 4 protein [uncultured Fusobacterium sp.]